MLERFGRVRHHFFFFREGKKDHTHFCLSSKNFKTKKHSSQTVVAALDMPLPEDYIRRLAPPPRSDSSVKCVVTGEPAKYRDPVTGAPYATVEAFKALRARGVVGSAAAAVQALKAASVAAAGEFFLPPFFPSKKRGPCVRKRRAFSTHDLPARGFTTSSFRMADTQERGNFFSGGTGSRRRRRPRPGGEGFQFFPRRRPALLFFKNAKTLSRTSDAPPPPGAGAGSPGRRPGPAVAALRPQRQRRRRRRPRGRGLRRAGAALVGGSLCCCPRCCSLLCRGIRRALPSLGGPPEGEAVEPAAGAEEAEPESARAGGVGPGGGAGPRQRGRRSLFCSRRYRSRSSSGSGKHRQCQRRHRSSDGGVPQFILTGSEERRGRKCKTKRTKNERRHHTFEERKN